MGQEMSIHGSASAGIYSPPRGLRDEDAGAARHRGTDHPTSETGWSLSRRRGAVILAPDADPGGHRPLGTTASPAPLGGSVAPNGSHEATWSPPPSRRLFGSVSLSVERVAAVLVDRSPRRSLSVRSIAERGVHAVSVACQARPARAGSRA